MYCILNRAKDICVLYHQDESDTFCCVCLSQWFITLCLWLYCI